MKLGTPSVVIVTERFEGLARGVAESREIPDFPLVILPPDVEQMDDDKLVGLGRKALDEAVRALLKSGEHAYGASR